MGNGCKIQGQNYVELPQGVGITAGYYYTNWILCIYSLCHNGVVVSMSDFNSNGMGSKPRNGQYDLLLNVWYSEPFVKEKQMPHFIFVVWSALVAGGCLMAAWGENLI